MRVIRGVGRFCYDFVIGDDGKIAAAVTVVMLTGTLLVLFGGVGHATLSTGLGLGMLIAFTVAIAIDCRRASSSA
jgi:hypothetical protein